MNGIGTDPGHFCVLQDPSGASGTDIPTPEITSRPHTAQDDHQNVVKSRFSENSIFSDSCLPNHKNFIENQSSRPTQLFGKLSATLYLTAKTDISEFEISEVLPIWYPSTG